MRRAPDLAAIHAAESRIAESGRDARASLERAAAALRERMARPSTLALAAGAAGLLAFWLARRPKPRAISSPASTNDVRTASAAGFVGAVALRYALQYLPFVVQHVRAALQKRATRHE